MNILVFKTNVSNQTQVKRLSTHMKAMEGVIKWSVDLHDCDKVLRIEASNLLPHRVEHIVSNAGYYCKELQD